MATNTFYRDFPEEYIVNLIYPIGSIYMSVENINPSTLFKNTQWSQIQDKFIAAAGSTLTINESTGSASKNYSITGVVDGHRLKIEEIPSHAHNIYYHTHESNEALSTSTNGSHQHEIKAEVGLNSASTNCINLRKAYIKSDSGVNTGGPDDDLNGIGYKGEHTHTLSGSSGKSNDTTGVSGDGLAHDHPFTISGQTTIDTLPPYLAVYTWQRTA